MPFEVRGVVALAEGRPVSVETIVVPDPGPGEAVVAVQACGVCHTDLHYREGGITADFPFLLGHEAAGVVEQVGDGVTSVAPGDFVRNIRQLVDLLRQIGQVAPVAGTAAAADLAVALLRRGVVAADDPVPAGSATDPGPRS